MQKIASNFLDVSSYGNDLSWIKRKTSNYLIYERGEVNFALLSGIHQDKILSSPNLGYNLYDYPHSLLIITIVCWTVPFF